MPERIVSRVEPEKVLHVINRRSEITARRSDFVAETEGLQVACFAMADGQTFRPHHHVPRPREIPRTQECCVIVAGSVLATYFDTDGSPLAEAILLPGDCSVTLEGGHNYSSREVDTLVYEIKTGPFVAGMEDRRFLD